ncbi:uncharacterized protein [Henckelia pumila]|uniref:uncharacterized protein n=1 Tax=Henckelia pumila TaxID=405737 RepID=UPI003C6E3E8C
MASHDQTSPRDHQPGWNITIPLEQLESYVQDVVRKSLIAAKQPQSKDITVEEEGNQGNPNPTAQEVIEEPLPLNYKSAKIREYDGSTDPCYIAMEIKSNAKIQASIFEAKQSGEESLRTYIKRFNKIALEVPTCAQETKITAFTQGLREGEFFKSLVKKAPRTFKDLLARAEKYINMEEAQRQKKEVARREGGREQGRSRENHDPMGRLFRYAPYRGTRDKAVHMCEERVDTQAPVSKEKLWKYCALHQECTHDTSECRSLQQRHQLPYVRDGRPVPKKPRSVPWFRGSQTSIPPRDATSSREKGKQEMDHAKKNKTSGDGPAKGIINMISGGSTDGDSNRARKAWSRRESLGVEEGRQGAGPIITFGPQDLEGVNLPHNGALLIQARIANYNVRRVFVDSGSSVNVLFQEAFEQMDLQGYALSPVKTALYGFAGHIVQPQGEMLLPITLGSGDEKRTVMTRFTLVEAPSSYNVILVKIDYKRARQNGKEGALGGREVCSVEESKSEYEEVEIELGQTGKSVKIARDLDAWLIEALRGCLMQNKDVFAWAQGDLVGVSSQVAEHKLNISPGSRPVLQKKRHFGAEKDKVIAEQVQELLRAGHIKEIQFPTWLSNVVLVPKATEKWRMCVDFRDLNKACPKDCYPLPRIDQLVDSTSGCELLSFMDAYQGYHQIPLALEDQDKVSFVTSGGTFCYVVMPFGLKNAGATYQRMMDRVFREQVGRNVEVYVDDILVKSRTRDSFLPDLEETFATVRRYGIKLNPAKCMFGVKSGKFLGFMVTERGIEVNPEKVKLLREMPSPTSINKVQRLTGRITALARFIARSAHRSYHFFQVLRNAQRFGWTEQCEQAFQELKEHLASLPILVKPEPGERLWIYLSTTEKAVSTVLIKEEKGNQRPVYYVSHALKGAKVRYTEIEKMDLALVITARKLRPYFLSHPVTVLTNSLLGRIMTHPDASGRLVKWSVELGEYDIEYQPRKAIKAQALSDFLTEVATFGQEEVWRVFVDGASGVGGSGVGIILISPAQEKIEIAVKLDFQASNNEAEYEAVIAGMQRAREVGQVNKTFCTREEKLIKYCKMIEELGASFNTWSIEQIPRKENMEANALAKRAVTGEGDSKESLMQRETVAAIEAREPVLQENTWKTPIVKYLTQGTLPEDKGRARIIRRQAVRFAILGGSLYRRSYQGPLLKCLGEGETEYVLQEVHEGCCGNHGGSMSLVRRVMLSGYWWPTLQADASKICPVLLRMPEVRQYTA